MSQDTPLTRAKEIVARQHTDALTSMNDEREFVDFFHDHRNDFLDDDHQVLHDGVLILLHAVQAQWHDAVAQIVDFFNERMIHSHWVTGVRACTTTTMADIFLARQHPEDKWLDGTTLKYIQPDILEHCLNVVLAKDPNYKLEHAMLTAVKAGRLDNLRVIAPHLNEDKMVKILYWGAYYGHTDIVDAFYTPERGRWIDNTRASHGQHKKKADPAGMAHLERLISACNNHETLTKAVDAAGQPSKPRKI